MALKVYKFESLKVCKFASLRVCQCDCYCAAGRWVVGREQVAGCGWKRPSHCCCWLIRNRTIKQGISRWWSAGRRMVISPSRPPLPRPSWTEVPSETVPQPTDCFLTFDKSQFFTVFLLPSLLPLDRAHFTSHGLGPLSCLTVSSPRTFPVWCPLECGTTS